MGTGIEWTQETWNPVSGCSKVSQGCKNCYAEVMAKRLAGRYGYPKEDPFAVTLHRDRLDMPLRWKTPRNIFVNSMSDLFHPEVPDDFIEEVFAVMACAPQHTFQVLTKRPERMAKWFSSNMRDGMVAGAAQMLGYRNLLPRVTMREFWPLRNVWIGTSVENQPAADWRIPHLLKCPAEGRFLSCEPLLGPLNVRPFLEPYGPAVHWVISGGESGPRARPCHEDWVRSLRDQCTGSEVPFFFKQWGRWLPASQVPEGDERLSRVESVLAGQRFCTGRFIDLGKKASGSLLDGQMWRQFPGQMWRKCPDQVAGEAVPGAAGVGVHA